VTARCDTSQNAIGGGPRKGARCLLLARHGHGRRPPERVRCPGNTGSGRDQRRLRGRLWRLRAGPKMDLQRAAAWV